MPELYLQAIIAVANMVTEIVKGQPPEVKKQLWDWYIEDVKRMRDLFKVGPSLPPNS